MKNNTKLISALHSIKPSKLNYRDWIFSGMALKYEGLELGVWINWNKNDPDNPHPKNYKQKWDSFKGSDKPVTGITIFSMARKNGWIDYSLQEDCLDSCDEINYMNPPFYDETNDFSVIEDIDLNCNYGYGDENDADVIDFDSYRTDDMYDCEITANRFSDDDLIVYDEELHNEYDVEDDYPLDNSSFCEDDICVESSMNDDTAGDPSMEVIADYEDCMVEDNSIFRNIPYEEEIVYDASVCDEGNSDDDYGHSGTEEYQNMSVIDDSINYEDENNFSLDYVEIDEYEKDTDAEEKKLKAYHGLFTPTDEVKPLKLEEIPDIDPLEFMCIKGLLFMDGTLLLTGASKSGKSYLGINMSISVATGKDWLGFKCKKGKVLYVDCENGLFQTQQRIKYLLEKFGISKEDYTENLRIYSYCNFKGSLDSFFEKLTKVAGEEYMMIIIDPIYKMLDGDENSSETMNRFIEKITALKASSKAAIVICHHEGKTGNTAKKIIDRSAGSSVLPRHPDAVVSITDLDEKMSCGGKKEKIEFQLRCFASPEAIEVCFVDGVHIPLNDDCNKQYLSITNKSKQLAHEDLLISAYKKLEETGRTVVVCELAKEMNVSLNTAKKYIDESEHFARNAKGVVIYVENQN